MHLGPKKKCLVPEEYKAFRLIRSHGRIYGIPLVLDPDNILYNDAIFRHPAVLSAATLPELQEQIDAFDEAILRHEIVGSFQGYDIVRLRGELYGVPRSAGPGDLHLPEERRRLGVISGANRAEIESAILRQKAAVPVEFAGWLPIFETAGNCGQHPQFTHTAEPPLGYRFTCSAPPRRWPGKPSLLTRIVMGAALALAALPRLPQVLTAFVRPRPGVTWRGRLRVIFAMFRLLVTLLGRGCRPLAVLRFLESRHVHSQLLLGGDQSVAFLTSIPLTVGQRPWIIEIEDPTTLFFPFIHNGHTAPLDVKRSPWLPIVKAMLEADHCKAILTHMKSTAEMVPALFDSEVIRRKVVYSPLGVRMPAGWQKHAPQPDDEPIHLLFINSWNQIPANFYFRGGLDVLEAFAILHERYPQLRLTMRTHLPPLDDRYHRILESGWVRVIQRFLPAEQMAELHAHSHIFLLPAARVHIVSLLQAMSHGLAVVASDGWGIEEYLTHERNGLIVRGRYGKVSWVDERDHLLREDYEPMYVPDRQVVDGLVEAVSRLVEDRGLRRRLGLRARRDVEMGHSLERWNEGLRQAFALATEGRSIPETRINERRGSSPPEAILTHGGDEPRRS